MLACVWLLYCLLVPVTPDTGYIECLPGSLNVILAAPHGGYEEPESIPDREAGCWGEQSDACVWSHGCGTQSEDNCDVNNVRDAYTKELTQLLADDLETLTSKRPHVVINDLHRKKLDANREAGEATLGDNTALDAFDEFHRCIDQAKVAIEADDCVGGSGLFIDMHGHGHPNNWAELGYLLSGSKLDSGEFDADDTSLYHLISESSLTLEQVLRGAQSFGHFLEEEGYESVPSPTNPGPSGESFFSGGYNTRVHGSKDGGTIDSIQIESSRTNRDPPEREAYSMAIAKATVKFLKAHYSDCEVQTNSGTSSGPGVTDMTGDVTDDVGDERTEADTSTEASATTVTVNTGWMLVLTALFPLFY